jgi:hypothetical protein
MGAAPEGGRIDALQPEPADQRGGSSSRDAERSGKHLTTGVVEAGSVKPVPAHPPKPFRLGPVRLPDPGHADPKIGDHTIPRSEVGDRHRKADEEHWRSTPGGEVSAVGRGLSRHEDESGSPNPRVIERVGSA